MLSHGRRLSVVRGISVDILDHLVGAGLKHLRVLDKLLVELERRGIVMPVADTLVSDHLDIHVLFAVEHTLAVLSRANPCS